MFAIFTASTTLAVLSRVRAVLALIIATIALSVGCGARSESGGDVAPSDCVESVQSYCAREGCALHIPSAIDAGEDRDAAICAAEGSFASRISGIGGCGGGYTGIEADMREPRLVLFYEASSGDLVAIQDTYSRCVAGPRTLNLGDGTCMGVGLVCAVTR